MSSLVSGLNTEQLRAVTTSSRQLLVLAGAGSGKTRVLTRRVAHLISTGVAPWNILAVTFTNKAAAEMKERVVELVGDDGERAWVATFHSTCARILRRDIEALGYTRGFAIYDDDDQVRLVRQIVKDLGLDPKKVSPRGLRSRIDHHKCRLYLPAEVDQDQEIPARRLVRVWGIYEERLRAANALDFNDLIGHVVRLFEDHPEVLERWQDRFHHILVDEYQDTNAAQYRLLALLAAKRRNLTVVGDDDQSIYGFRGADVSNILDFEQDWPEAEVVRLEQNYRSSGNILMVANTVVASNPGRLAKKLWTTAAAGPKVALVVCPTPNHEAQRVVRAIAELRRTSSICYADVAIIYRTNATSRVFEQALTKARIPHRVVGSRKFYERREIRDVLAYLRLVRNPNDDAAFLRVVNVPSRGIGAKTLDQLRERAGADGVSLLRAAATFPGSTKRARALRSFSALVAELDDVAPRMEPVEVLQTLYDRSGYLAMLQAEDTEDSARRLGNLDELLRDAAEPLGYETADPRERLYAWLDRVALTGADDEIPEGGEVTLMTVHNAKGLEFPVVFVVHMVEGQFPHARSAETDLEEERRLAYVAFTRAKHRLVITRSRQTTLFLDGGRAVTRPAAPSRFLHAIPQEACQAGLSPPSGLQDFLAHHRAAGTKPRVVRRRPRETPEAPPPQGGHTLLDLVDPAQLKTGVRVHHPRWGLGVVQGRAGSGSGLQVRVKFGSRRPLTLRVQGSRLSVVVD